MTCVLFVDDEPALLDGLRRSLYRAQKKWDMSFVPSAALAMKQLESRPYDVIVADMRMAQLDGAELLAMASESSPDTVRIVLSGYSEPSQTMRLVPLAHRYLAKPCEPFRLEQTIERCLSLRALIADPAVRSIVGRMRQIPAIPATYAQLRALLAQEQISAEQLAHLIATDSAIAAKVLQVANSAFFRHARSIDTLEQAVIHLGFDVIRNLVLSAEVFCAWPQGALPDGLAPEHLQSHVQTIAESAYLLAGTAPWAHDAMLAGLLHDFGYWVLLWHCPEEVARSIELARSEALSIQEAEYAVFKTSHAEVGAYLLGLWGLPDPIVEAIAHHHDPSAAAEAGYGIGAALAVAHAITDASAPGPFIQRGFDRGRDIGPSYLTAMHAPFDWRQAEQRIANHRA